jgi:uncharacterized protein (DUF1800 family)
MLHRLVPGMRMSTATAESGPLTSAIAAHRFGLGEASLERIGADPRGWLRAQIGPADAALGDELLDGAAALATLSGRLSAVQAARRAAPPASAMPPAAAASNDAGAAIYRDLVLSDARSRLTTAALTARPFAERLHLFWANHFTVSQLKAASRGLVGAFEREAIRPHIAGRFEDLLWASTTHPAMLRYLDNTQSAGPHSRAVAREARRAARMDEGPRVSGLNENLAREVLELHTLGAQSARGPRPAYTQADVTAFAAVLTGWRVPLRAPGAARPFDPAQPFDPAWHEPGPKTLLGKTYPEGPDALRLVVRDLARDPATARFIATKLARHVVADDPPGALVERLAAAYQRSDGELAAVYRALIDSPEAWQPQPAKLKTPEEFAVSAARLLRFDARVFERADPLGIGALGQRIQSAPSPAGWSDRAEDWLGPDAVWKRVEWSHRSAQRIGSRVDARRLAPQSLGPLLGDETRRQLDRAADGAQALALLLMAPEFQRR